MSKPKKYSVLLDGTPIGEAMTVKEAYALLDKTLKGKRKVQSYVEIKEQNVFYRSSKL